MSTKQKITLTELQKAKCKSRINRFIGQANGIINMIENDRDCEDILIQIAAVTSAMKGLGQEVLKSNMKNSVAEGAKHNNFDSIDDYLKLYKYLV